MGHGGKESIDELEVWSVEAERALEMDELRDLSSGSLRYGWVAAEKLALSLPNFEKKIDSLSEVGDSDTSSKIKDLVPFRSVQIQSRSFNDNMILQSTETVGNVFSSKFSPLGSSPNRYRHLVGSV